MINDTSIISSNEGNSSTSSLPINDKEIKENKISVEQTSPEPITNIAQNVPNNSSLANVTSKSDLIMNDELSEQTTSAIGKNIIIDDKSTNETIPTIKSKDVTDPQKKTGLSNIEEPSNLPHKASNSTEKLLNNTVSSGKSKSSNSSEENNLLNSYEVSLPEISSSKNQTADETESKYSPNLSDELNLINQGKQIQQDNSSQIFDHSHLHKTLESHLKDNKTLNNTDSKHYNNEKENPNGTTTIKNSELGNLDEPSTPNQKIFTPLTSTNSESSNNTIPSLNLSEINKHNHLQNSSNSTHIIPNSDLHKTISNKDIDSPNTTVSGDNENINNKTVSSDKPVDTNESTVSFPINTPNLSSNSNSALNSTNINTIPGIENPKHEHNKTSENIPPEENETTIPKNDTGSQNYTNTETAQFSQLTETPDDPLNITDTRNIDVSNSSYSGSSSSADAHSYHETIPTQTGNETKSYATAEAEAESFTETKKVTHEDDILSGTDVVPDLLFHNKTIPGYNGTINIMENGTSGFTFTELKNITIEEDNVSGSISSARAFAFDDIESDSDKNKTKNVTQVEETESAVLNFNETRTVTTENDIIIMAIPDAAETSNATSPFSNKTGNLTDNLVASPAEYIVEVRKLITINDTINESAESATALSYHKTGLNGTDADKNITISAASDGNVTITITRVIEEDIYKRVSADEIAKYEGNSSSVNNTKSFDLAAADAVGTVIATVYHNSTKETVSGSEAVATATTNGTNTTSYTAVMNTGSPIIIEDISSESVEIVPENRHIDALNNTSREDFIPESSESSNTDSAPGDEDQISK
ncbi:putative uncharacterized protein DDB_G0282133 [Galleria mellonella]|uniref:Dentin sialophosphoprotein-like n=1 Tax=Galleria mellonella TaxID=7137 RepID=A0ABM3MWE7_GALME|nr:putative uncharacterized protein DDB_G0282133 [Galleria mellonella]